jgi:pyruvate dehydrogenase E2 component (dihydrolipoamide acetyltransferase)
MAISVVMPNLGFIMTEGTVIEWLKKPGDLVSKGEPLLVIESEKANVEVESPGSGTLGPNLAPPGTTVPVATSIGYILEPGEEPAPELEFKIGEVVQVESSTRVVAQQPAAATSSGEQKEEETPGAERILASPSARRLAREHGVDLAKIEGTGPRGRIIDRDVLAFVEIQAQLEKESRVRVSPVAQKLASELGVDLTALQGTGPGGRVIVEDVRRASRTVVLPQPSPGPASEPVELTRIQRIAAERMSISFRTAPHFYLSIEVDMSQVVAMRDALGPTVEADAGARLSFSDILLLIVARALRQHPSLNAAFQENQIRRYQEINIALAVDTAHGLTVPVFHRADQMSLTEITRQRAELVEKAQNNRLTYDDLSHATFTVSNLGMFGVDVFSAIINPPQAAILAVGRIAKRPFVVDDALLVRPTMWLTLSVDHRAADGAIAARFLQTLVRYLEQPYQLLVGGSRLSE